MTLWKVETGAIRESYPYKYKLRVKDPPTLSPLMHTSAMVPVCRADLGSNAFKCNFRTFAFVFRHFKLNVFAFAFKYIGEVF